jgi:hypothetical protein
VTLSIAEFDAHASPGSAEAWNAYAFAHVEVVVDKLDGEVGSIAASKEFLDAGVAGARARDRLDAFLNSAVRAAKSYRVGQVAAASLDAADAIAPALETVFAIQRRVRPYNGYLAWELDRHPLELVGDADRLVSAVIDVASGSNAGPPTALVRSVEKIARLAGLGGVIDAWDDASLTLIRGD